MTSHLRALEFINLVHDAAERLPGKPAPPCAAPFPRGPFGTLELSLSSSVIRPRRAEWTPSREGKSLK